jgi:hypothetical protein
MRGSYDELIAQGWTEELPVVYYCTLYSVAIGTAAVTELLIW